MRGEQYQIAIDKLKDTIFSPVDFETLKPVCKKCKSNLIEDDTHRDVPFMVRYTCPTCRKSKILKKRTGMKFVDFKKN